MTVTEAEDRAKTLSIDGKGVYEISLEQWVKLFGIQGQTIFNELQERNYGHVRFVFLLLYTILFRM